MIESKNERCEVDASFPIANVHDMLDNRTLGANVVDMGVVGTNWI